MNKVGVIEMYDVQIMWDNIQTEPINMKHNFDQHVTDGDNLGTI